MQPAPNPINGTRWSPKKRGPIRLLWHLRGRCRWFYIAHINDRCRLGIKYFSRLGPLFFFYNLNALNVSSYAALGYFSGKSMHQCAASKNLKIIIRHQSLRKSFLADGGRQVERWNRIRPLIGIFLYLPLNWAREDAIEWNWSRFQ